MNQNTVGLDQNTVGLDQNTVNLFDENFIKKRSVSAPLFFFMIKSIYLFLTIFFVSITLPSIIKL
jgi:hypothetical protein